MRKIELRLALTGAKQYVTPDFHRDEYQELHQCDVRQYVATIAPRLLRIHAAAADFGVFVLDSLGNVMSWNALARAASGYGAEEILGHNFSTLYAAADQGLCDSSSQGRLASALAIATAIGRCEDQAALVGKNAVCFWAEIAITAVREVGGELCGFACVIRDISEWQRSGVKLANARDASFEFSRLKAAFLANISHEFRTPLNIILGYNDLIGEHLAEVRDTSQDDCLEAVARAGKRLLRTLNAVLDYSKLEARSLEVNPRAVALIPLIRGLLDELGPQAAQKSLRLAFRFEEDAAVVTIDEYCLTHALRNLLENAIKFTERGSITTRLYREPGGAVCISVADTGIGVERAYMPHLLEPFSQADSGVTRRFEGAGLGLALTRSYLELNHARLTVSSEEGFGSTFTIHFAPASAFASDRFELSHKA